MQKRLKMGVLLLVNTLTVLLLMNTLTVLYEHISKHLHMVEVKR